MTWTTRFKTIPIRPPVGHPDARPNVIGRAPGTPAIDFSPWEIYGAAARCTHLHLIDPRAVTPEATMMRLSFERHIDDTSGGFFLLPSARRLKEYAENYLIGTLGAALAYLYLVKDGYTWIDHAENLTTATGALADFVLAHDTHPGLALLEATASRQVYERKFNNTVFDKYTAQIKPHLGSVFGNGLVTHGYAIGAWLPTPQPAEFFIHHTVTPAGRDYPSDKVAPDDPIDPRTDVQRGNYADAFRLAFGIQRGEAIRRGVIDESFNTIFTEFDWMGRTWLTYAPFLISENVSFREVRSTYFVFEYQSPYWMRFAIEKDIAEAVLKGIRNGADGQYRFKLNRIPDYIREEARASEGAIFPDGLAILRNSVILKHTRWCRWNLDRGFFEDAASEN